MTLSFKNHLKSTANIIDGKLILSFPGAINPTVWQMDLATTKASALEVQKTEDHFDLVLKIASKDTQKIASFTTQTEAVTALTATSKAMENASGKIHPSSSENSYNYSKPKSGILKTLAKIIGVLAVLFIIYLIIGIATLPKTGALQQSNTTQQNPAESSNGVPMSAEDFLTGR